MSVGIGIIGREITFTLGGAAITGVNSKGFTFNNEALDTTDDNSLGWQERLAISGVKSVEFTFSGIVKNLELIAAYNGTSQIFPIVSTYPDGSTLTFDAFMDNISNTGEANGLTTFDASFSSSGVVVFVAGT
jgi:predicted secreted protein